MFASSYCKIQTNNLTISLKVNMDKDWKEKNSHYLHLHLNRQPLLEFSIHQSCKYQIQHFSAEIMGCAWEMISLASVQGWHTNLWMFHIFSDSIMLRNWQDTTITQYVIFVKLSSFCNRLMPDWTIVIHLCLPELS